MSPNVSKWLRFLALAGVIGATATAQMPPPPPPPLPLTVPTPAANPITESKRVLGKILFWEEQMSSDNTVSCGTCHRPEEGGTDPRIANNPGPDGIFGNQDDVNGSPGIVQSNSLHDFTRNAQFLYNRQVTGRRAPDYTGMAFSSTGFWDGRAGGTLIDPDTNLVVIPSGAALENQALGPLLATNEMAHAGRAFADVTARLASVKPLRLATNIPADMANAIAVNTTYPALFNAAFGSSSITAVRIAMAIATYERTLIPNQSPFDAWTNGNPTALTPPQMMGWGAFNSPGARCNQCHTGAATSDFAFHNLGLRPVAEDTGRQAVTLNVADRGKFKTPWLRNVNLRDRFFHNGRIAGIQGAVGFYGGGAGPNPDNRDPILNGIGFPQQVGDQIVAFLSSLNDPRVPARIFPFDRPTLRSELGPAAFRFGPTSNGSGGVAPFLITNDFLSRGNSDFRIGVGSGLGGATAYIVFSSGTSVPATLINNVPISINPSLIVATAPYVLSGTGAGQGSATFHASIPDIPGLVGTVVSVQWIVVDPAAPGGAAASAAATYTVF